MSNLRHMLEVSAAHKEAFKAGKQAATEQIFADLEKLLDKHFTKANFTDGTCTFLYDRDLEVDIADLKKKYGVSNERYSVLCNKEP